MHTLQVQQQQGKQQPSSIDRYYGRLLKGIDRGKPTLSIPTLSEVNGAANWPPLTESGWFRA